ncbi:MAG: leucine-rich repeat domain-containing protein [Bacteroidaceae bacterium]|nr:leucine-rich repeat domain-containing protein [Bacteroidaceae bacterium]
MIMKKLLFFIFTLLLPLVASADVSNININGIYYNLFDKDKTAEVASNRLCSGDAIIPETVTYNDNQYSVTSIGDEAFHYCSGLTSITIPNSVSTIGKSAFSGCTGLTSITIPNSVTRIGEYAFSNCTRLTSITIPNSVTTIGGWAFSGCSGLTSITIPKSVTSIGRYAFYDCYVTKENFHNQSNITLSGLTVCDVITESGNCIKYNALVKYRGKETTITIPNSVTSIGYGAFSGCFGLTSITIPSSVTSIGQGAFSSCIGLTSVTIPNSVTTIGEDAFKNCRKLTSITIPNSVTNIGVYAFYECTGLTSITIPNSVTSIGGWAFSGCSRLTSITIPNSVTSIEYSAFYDCKNLKTVYCYTTKLPETDENTFGIHGIYINYATLYVPASAINEYKATAPWRWFGTILPIEDATTQIDATSSNNCNIITNGNDIIVKSDADGEKVSIYTISGQLIGATAIRNGSAVINTNLKSGSVAIVMIGQNTYKIRLD